MNGCFYLATLAFSQVFWSTSVLFNHSVYSLPDKYVILDISRIHSNTIYFPLEVRAKIQTRTKAKPMKVALRSHDKVSARNNLKVVTKC